MVNWKETTLLFPGQGSQTVGMGKTIAENYPGAAEVFAEADAILDVPFSRLCWEGPEAELNDTYNTQPALFVTSIAILRALQYELQQRNLPALEPAFVAGHSLGELTALVASEALSFEDGLRLVRERGRLMKEADQYAPGGMAAIIGLDHDKLQTVVDEATQTVGKPVVIANDNCPGQVVISGDNDALAKAMELAQGAGAKMVTRLAVSIAAHSPLMARAAADFAKAVEITPFQLPKFPVVANASAQPLTDIASIHTELNAQLTSAVRWTETIQFMLGQGVKNFVELGSKDVLVGLVKRIDRSAARHNVETPEQIAKLLG